MNEKFILTIIDKFNTSSIGELDIGDGTYHLTLKKERTVKDGLGAIDGAGIPAEHSVRLGISANAASGTTGSSGNPQIAADGVEKITSPIVATYYSAPGPDAPPFVKPGSRIKTGETLCILEAMKMMNHLEAEFNCEITEIHAVNGDMIEYGQDLFTVKRI